MKMRQRRRLTRFHAAVPVWAAFIEPVLRVAKILEESLRDMARQLSMEPAAPRDGQLWVDLARGLVMQYSGSEQRWVKVGYDVG